MLSLEIKPKPEKTPKRKEERLLLFSANHSKALFDALAYAGVQGVDAEPVVKQLRNLAESGTQMMSGTNGGEFAIFRADRALNILDKMHELYDTLSDADAIMSKDIELEIGHRLTKPRKKRRSTLRKKGRRALDTTISVADYISDGAESVFLQAVDRVFEGGNSCDQSLRELCRAVHDCWEAATSRALPSTHPSFGYECWALSDVGLLNPLWIVLDTLNITIGKRALNCLVAYANGEPVKSAKEQF